MVSLENATIHPKQEDIPIKETLDKNDLTAIGDTLVSLDLDLLSIAISHSTPVDAQRLINDIVQSTQIDLRDPRITSVMTPEHISKLKTFEYNHRTQLLAMIQESFSKQALQSNRISSSSKASVFRRILASALIGVSLLYVCAITWIPIPTDNIRFADTILGFLLGTVISTVVNFYFGSSVRQSDLAKYHEEKIKELGEEFRDKDITQ